VRINVPRACPVSAEQAYSVLYAAGDFDVTGGAAFQGIYLSRRGEPLSALPKNTRSLLADLVDGPRGYHGVNTVPAQGAVDLLAWPKGESCALTGSVDGRAEATLGSIGGRYALVIGGRSTQGVVARSFVADLGTGVVTALPIGLASQRIAATITAFGAAAVVAGGLTPDALVPIDTAEVYEHRGSEPGDFSPDRIALAEPRGAHGAVELATGETLLVGGVGRGGALLSSMEVIDPTTRRTRTQGVAILGTPRKNPKVLRLSSGAVLVAGGEREDGSLVQTLEWFSADARAPSRPSRDLVATRIRDFVALPAGGALAVMVPEPAVKDFQGVWIITADGALEPALRLSDAKAARLFPGLDGAPILWNGNRWLRYDPWVAALLPMSDAPSVGPPAAAVAPDSGLVLWLETSGAETLLRGFRHGARSNYQDVSEALLVDSTRYFAPDRRPGAEVAFDPRLGLTLGPGTLAALTDVDFAEADIELESPSKALALVVLRDGVGGEVIAGGPSCPLPPGASLRVRRQGARVTASVDGGEPVVCSGLLRQDARVRVWLQGALQGSTCRSFRGHRTPLP
jgi:hypothetical protein